MKTLTITTFLRHSYLCTLHIDVHVHCTCTLRVNLYKGGEKCASIPASTSSSSCPPGSYFPDIARCISQTLSCVFIQSTRFVFPITNITITIAISIAITITIIIVITIVIIFIIVIMMVAGDTCRQTKLWEDNQLGALVCCHQKCIIITIIISIIISSYVIIMIFLIIPALSLCLFSLSFCHQKCSWCSTRVACYNFFQGWLVRKESWRAEHSAWFRWKGEFLSIKYQYRVINKYPVNSKYSISINHSISNI